MRIHWRRKVTGLLLAALVLSICCTTEVQSYFSLPAEQRLAVGDQLPLLNKLPQNVLNRLTISVEGPSPGILGLNGQVIKESFSPNYGNPVALQPGQADLRFRLFGVIPIKKMVVDVIQPVRLVPGGHSIGVLLHGDGVQVIGYSPIQNKDGQNCDPAEQSGIEIGDMIVSVNGQSINSDEEIALLIDKLGQENQEVILVVKHNETTKEIQLKPVFCAETKRWRIGLYVKDGAAGVGTLTFYNPATRQYGALGHVIIDTETNNAVEVRGGRITGAFVEGIQPGKRGQPGEKIGMFANDGIGGTIDKNSRFGIFGILDKNLANEQFPEAIPVAMSSQVKEGDAQILTVVEGNKIDAFNIKIERVLPYRTDGKSMVIRVVDDKLLAKTGGIIQGMSGSPIIQNGRLVGAVTHVFVNDPSRGYGLLLELMLSEAQNSPKQISFQAGRRLDLPRSLL